MPTIPNRPEPESQTAAGKGTGWNSALPMLIPFWTIVISKREITLRPKMADISIEVDACSIVSVVAAPSENLFASNPSNVAFTSKASPDVVSVEL